MMTNDDEPLDHDRIPKPLSYPLERTREDVLERLQAAYVEGVLTGEEFEERMDLAGTARNHAELAVLLEDLPGAEVALEKKEAPSTALVPAENRALVPASSGETVSLVAILGESERRGAWHVPPVVKATAVLGEARVDLVEAHLSPVTEIQCKAILGEITIMIPQGVRVQSEGVAVLGDFTSKEEAHADANAPVVRITGLAFLGSVNVKVDGGRSKGRGEIVRR